MIIMARSMKFPIGAGARILVIACGAGKVTTVVENGNIEMHQPEMSPLRIMTGSKIPATEKDAVLLTVAVFQFWVVSLILLHSVTIKAGRGTDVL